MTHSFVHIQPPLVHAGVDRAEHALGSLRTMGTALLSSRALSTGINAAVVSALVLTFSGHGMEGFAEGLTLSAWVNAWVVTFAALMLLSQPIRQLVGRLNASWVRMRERQRQADADWQLWQWAQHDPRVMADLRAALSRS